MIKWFASLLILRIFNSKDYVIAHEVIGHDVIGHPEVQEDSFGPKWYWKNRWSTMKAKAKLELYDFGLEKTKKNE